MDAQAYGVTTVWEEPPEGDANLAFPPGFGPSAAPAPAPAASKKIVGIVGKQASSFILDTKGSTKANWYMDSGASEHFACARETLHDYIPDTEPVYVKVANKQKVLRVGVGSLKVVTNVNGVVIARREYLAIN